VPGDERSARDIRTCPGRNRYFTHTSLARMAISVVKHESKDRFIEACSNYKTREETK